MNMLLDVLQEKPDGREFVHAMMPERHYIEDPLLAGKGASVQIIAVESGAGYPLPVAMSSSRSTKFSSFTWLRSVRMKNALHAKADASVRRSFAQCGI